MRLVRHVRAEVRETWFSDEAGDFDDLGEYLAEQYTISEEYECHTCGAKFRKLDRAKAHKCRARRVP